MGALLVHLLWLPHGRGWGQHGFEHVPPVYAEARGVTGILMLCLYRHRWRLSETDPIESQGIARLLVWTLVTNWRLRNPHFRMEAAMYRAVTIALAGALLILAPIEV